MRGVWYGGKEYSDYDPHYPESEEIEGTERISLDLDADIYIDKNGNWEYEDEEYPWAKPDDGQDIWYSESSDYPEIEICDTDVVVECVDELLESFLPYAEGRYHIAGDVELVFEVSDIIRYFEYLGQGSKNGDDPVYDEEYFTRDATVEFNFRDSSIRDFTLEKL